MDIPTQAPCIGERIIAELDELKLAATKLVQNNVNAINCIPSLFRSIRLCNDTLEELSDDKLYTHISEQCVASCDIVSGADKAIYMKITGQDLRNYSSCISKLDNASAALRSVRHIPITPKRKKEKWKKMKHRNSKGAKTIITHAGVLRTKLLYDEMVPLSNVGCYCDPVAVHSMSKGVCISAAMLKIRNTKPNDTVLIMEYGSLNNNYTTALISSMGQVSEITVVLCDFEISSHQNIVKAATDKTKELNIFRLLLVRDNVTGNSLISDSPKACHVRTQFIKYTYVSTGWVELYSTTKDTFHTNERVPHEMFANAVAVSDVQAPNVVYAISDAWPNMDKDTRDKSRVQYEMCAKANFFFNGVTMHICDNVYKIVYAIKSRDMRVNSIHEYLTQLSNTSPIVCFPHNGNKWSDEFYVVASLVASKYAMYNVSHPIMNAIYEVSAANPTIAIVSRWKYIKDNNTVTRTSSTAAASSAIQLFVMLRRLRRKVEFCI